MMRNTAEHVKRVSLLLAERFQTGVLAKTAASGLLGCVANGVLVSCILRISGLEVLQANNE